MVFTTKNPVSWPIIIYSGSETVMTFSEAMLLLAEGKAVRRVGWEEGYPFERGRWLRLAPHDLFGSIVCAWGLRGYSKSNYMILGHDLIADDWEEVKIEETNHKG